MITLFPAEYRADKSLGLEDFQNMALYRFNRAHKVLLENLKDEGPIKPLGQQGWCIARIFQISTGKRTRISLDSPLSKGLFSYSLDVAEEGLVAGLVLGFKIQNARITQIRYPDLKTRPAFKRKHEAQYMACISDIHVGSIYFAADEFDTLIKYLNGRPDVKYLFIAGDSLDGCGVFQDQLGKQELKTFNQQLNKFSRLLRLIDRRITILVGPGNHDNRDGRLEPQPPVRSGTLPFPANVLLLTNPCRLNLENGLKILYDHGTGLGTCIDKLGFLSYENVGEAMKYLLKNRHLAPLLSVALPGAVDVKCIQEEPDLFIAGHVHKWTATLYKGTLCINCGTFERPAPYVTLLGINPDVALATLVNVHDVLDVTRVSFSGDTFQEEKYVCVE